VANNHFPGCSTDFLIAHITDEYLYIIDTSFITGNSITVTDNISDVVKYLHDQFNLGNKRLIYRDIRKLDREIFHANELFLAISKNPLAGIILPDIITLIKNQINTMDQEELESLWLYIIKQNGDS
jgi:DUF917 family protein